MAAAVAGCGRRRVLLAACLLVVAAHASSLHLTAAAEAAAEPPGRRRLLIRPLPSGPGTCRNSYQGPLLMADDRGKVCTTKDLDYFTGCCRAGQQHTCDKCSALDSCCATLEHCVSCCMAPANRPETRRKEAPRWSSNPADAVVWADAWEYCLATCRSHKGSTAHENAYIGPRHHCFSPLGKPMTSPPLPAGALDDVDVVLSTAGASCTAACEQRGGARCSRAHLHWLNSCDRLREVLNCEAGCVEEAGSPDVGIMPASVDPEAPKASRPALCLVSRHTLAAGAGGATLQQQQQQEQEGFSCDASANYMRRLCPCVPADKQQQADKAAAAAGGNAAGGAAATAGRGGGGAVAEEGRGERLRL